MNMPQDAVFQRIQVHHVDVGGWLRFFTDADSTDHPDLAFYLSYAVTQWFRANPHYRLRFILPINKSGNTVEMHAWYEQHLFADRSGIHSENGSGLLPSQ
jgi:hypothetical protein